MAASSAQRPGGPCQAVAFALLLVASLSNAEVTAQDDVATTRGGGTTRGVVTATVPTAAPESYVGGNMIPKASDAAEPQDPQMVVFPTMGSPTEATTGAAATGTEEAGRHHNQAAAEVTGVTARVHVNTTEIVAAETPAPLPARGDGPNNIPRLVPQDDVVCVSKEAVQDKNAVNLKLKASSSCKDTKVKIESVLQELCGEDCKLDLYQEDNSDQILVSGKYVEDDVAGMADKFNNDNIKDKTDVEQAVPRWGKNSKLVLVSLLLTGLLLAALLVAAYYLKTHRKNSKGVRLAESFQVDEENQANTLVSVAPLPQEPLDKPSANGESPAENGTNPAPTANGHSATQTPVADTEM
ncbi:hematopoietic progenitor cell antigen CD34 isoform X1 [Pseudoliparis swirei]|uniref:hematopoietic progenitor cell antigen CD34 isoform X1 n=1 Tax=Pseudoliparis swirei TaxID=2059687 RepID=UPI0024BED8BD|nr:hematopoietic progenitor cell antigen CD34 isoform X1 [Pseudoliparis swirei]